MSTIQQPGPTSREGPITFADVLAAIPRGEDGQPLPFASGVNAGSIRTSLGRGSNQTIQRHLDEIRRQVSALSVPALAGATPPAPSDAVAAIWSAAWSAAQAATLARLDRITAERDSLSTLSAAQAADLEASGAEADALRDAAATAAQATTKAQATLEELRLQLEGDRSASTSTIAGLRSDLARVQVEAEAAAKLAAANWEIERQALRSQVNSLLERVSELRALEIWAAMQSKAVPPAAQSGPDPKPETAK
jgi:hypothetical protein